jgi:hypothetical protein
MTDIRLEVNGIRIPPGLRIGGQDWEHIQLAAKFKKVGFFFGRRVRSLFQTKDVFFAKNPDISFFGGKVTVSASLRGPRIWGTSAFLAFRDGSLSKIGVNVIENEEEAQVFAMLFGSACIGEFGQFEQSGAMMIWKSEGLRIALGPPAFLVVEYLAPGQASVMDGAAASSDHSARALSSKLDAGVNIVKAGIAIRLFKSYSVAYDQTTAAKLTAAVANELFDDPPGNAEADAFRIANPELIRKKLLELVADRETREDLTLALRVKVMATYAGGGPVTAQLLDPIKKLGELGLLIPFGDSPSLDAFDRLVEKYRPLVFTSQGHT